jgi:hypothetical protein
VKAEESSSVVAFRALVMLACLIVVPLAAIFGSTCPDIVRSLLIEPLLGPKIAAEVCDRNGRIAPANDGFAAIPGSRPAPDSGNAPAWPGVGEIAAPNGFPSIPSGAAPLQPAPVFGGTGKTPPAGALASFDAPVESPSSSPWPRLGGASSNPPNPATPPPLAPGSAPPATSTGGLQPPDRFSVIERRLREDGAIYYLLETWGNDGELYRFHCKMAIANNPNCTRHFEATHREATQAMTQVLEQIEAWRAGRLP